MTSHTGQRIIQTGEGTPKDYAVWEIHLVMKLEVITMKWEIITDELSKAGLSLGCSSVRSNYAATPPGIQALRRREAPDDAGPPDAQLSAPVLHLSALSFPCPPLLSVVCL